MSNDLDFKNAPSPTLSRLTSELRAAADDERAAADLDFSRMEKALFARVDAEASRRRFRSRVSMGAGMLAVAAAAILFVGRANIMTGDRAEGPVSNAASNGPATADPGAGELEQGEVTSATRVIIRTNGGGELAPRALGRGESLRRGDVIATTHAVFRSAGRVAFEVGSAPNAASPARLRVSETDRPIVLALDNGVVEAQVDKVASGEAFAVDTGDVRIAVHGTHLRVVRDGQRVTLDLTEGIVNVGHAPKSGSTYGTLVTAPAHAEFDVDALETTFVMTKDPARVRTADDLTAAASNAGNEATAMAGTRGAVSPPEQSASTPQSDQNHAEKKPNSGPSAQTSTSAGSAGGRPPAAVADTLGATRTGVIGASSGTREQQEETGRAAISHAIETCVHDKLQPGDVRLTLESTLNLSVGEDGYVQAARFDPPLDPEVQKCAAGTIYRVRFARGGSQLVPISLQR